MMSLRDNKFGLDRPGLEAGHENILGQLDLFQFMQS